MTVLQRERGSVPAELLAMYEGATRPPGAATGRAGRYRGRRPSSAVTAVGLVGVALVGLGVLLALFLLYFFAFTPLSGVRNQHHQLLSLHDSKKAVFSLAAGKTPAEGTAVAVLTIPALQEKVVVVRGASPTDLQQGPGLIIGSALPGQPGNAVVEGRRVTYGAPFANIASLAIGDQIQAVDGVGHFTFRIVQVAPLPANGELRAPGTAAGWLTLVTSASSLLSSEHVVVTAALVGNPAPASVRHSSTAAPVRLDLNGDSAAAALAVLWAIAFFAGLAFGLYALRRWQQPVVAYVLAVPILLACGLLVCENLARCLPATL